MTENRRVYTADQLEEMRALDPDPRYGGHRLARDEEDEHRWYVVWRYVFEDVSDDTVWAVLVAEGKSEDGEIPWYYWYDDPEHIEAWRVRAEPVITTKWVDYDD